MGLLRASDRVRTPVAPSLGPLLVYYPILIALACNAQALELPQLQSIGQD